MSFLLDIDEVRAVQWGASYSWDIRIVQGPGYTLPGAPFNSWFPAYDVTWRLADVKSMSFDTAQSEFSIPKNMVLKELVLSFLDDDTCTLEQWFEEWINSKIFAGGMYVTPLFDIMRAFQIARLSIDKAVIGTTDLMVYPIGDLVFMGHSEGSNTKRLSMTFAVVNVKSGS